MILVNIVALVALASALLMLMLSNGADGVDRSIGFREASQAAVLARAGELSAAAALRRDAEEAPAIDHLREPWARVMEQEAAIAGGTFTLEVTDAQARFNLNNLGLGALVSAAAAAPLASVLRVDPAVVERIGAAVRERGPLISLSELRELGLDDPIIARLAPLVTLLPQAAPVNLNSASEELISVLTGSPAAARMLVAQRDRAGFVTEADLNALGILMPAGAGLTSNHYWVRTTVTIGGTAQTLTSLLARTTVDGRPVVVTLGRWRGAAAPDRMPAAP